MTRGLPLDAAAHLDRAAALLQPPNPLSPVADLSVATAQVHVHTAIALELHRLAVAVERLAGPAAAPADATSATATSWCSTRGCVRPAHPEDDEHRVNRSGMQR